MPRFRPELRLTAGLRKQRQPRVNQSIPVSTKHLDVAQLVKHYLGLIRHLKTSETPAVSLVYLYWEPTNGYSVETCIQHRNELEAFSQRVSQSEIQFVSRTYSDLWKEWQECDGLRKHVDNLTARYRVQL